MMDDKDIRIKTLEKRIKYYQNRYRVIKYRQDRKTKDIRKYRKQIKELKQMFVVAPRPENLKRIHFEKALRGINIAAAAFILLSVLKKQKTQLTHYAVLLSVYQNQFMTTKIFRESYYIVFNKISRLNNLITYMDSINLIKITGKTSGIGAEEKVKRGRSDGSGFITFVITENGREKVTKINDSLSRMINKYGRYENKKT